jgi:ribosomal protein S18 acetylase RimI-like enzyme
MIHRPRPSASGATAVVVRRLGALDAEAFRELRLEGLAGHPEAFGASWEEEAARPLSWFAERLERNAVFGGWTGGGAAMAGVAGLLVPEAAKLRHKGVLWGAYVRPPARRAGLGAALVAAVLAHARGVVEEVRLSVVASNAAAARFYATAGFERYGIERRALRVAGRYYDEALMAVRLGGDGAGGSVAGPAMTAQADIATASLVARGERRAGSPAVLPARALPAVVGAWCSGCCSGRRSTPRPSRGPRPSGEVRPR